MSKLTRKAKKCKHFCPFTKQCLKHHQYGRMCKHFTEYQGGYPIQIADNTDLCYTWEGYKEELLCYDYKEIPGKPRKSRNVLLYRGYTDTGFQINFPIHKHDFGNLIDRNMNIENVLYDRATTCGFSIILMTRVKGNKEIGMRKLSERLKDNIKFHIEYSMTPYKALTDITMKHVKEK